MSRAKANRVLPREHSGHSKQHNTGEDSTRGRHQMVNTEIRLIIYPLQPKMEKLYTVSKNRTGS